MDLRTVYSRLTSVALEESRLKQDGPFLSNITAFKALVESLADVPAFATRAENFRNSPLARVGGDQATWDESQTSTIRELGDQFCHSAVGLRDALAVLVKPLPPESIVVKLPPEIDLASVVDTLQKIEQALVVLVREPQIGGHVVVKYIGYLSSLKLLKSISNS